MDIILIKIKLKYSMIKVVKKEFHGAKTPI